MVKLWRLSHILFIDNQADISVGNFFYNVFMRFLELCMIKLKWMTDSRIITIFFVDDNALYLKDLELSFSAKPYYNIIAFPTGELCLEKLALKPDIIILDYYLNSVKENAINGLETLKKIRAVDTTVPVVMLSDEKDPEVANNCMIHRATEYIIKSSISFARLREIITTVFIDKQVKADLISELNHAVESDNGKV
jgi:DNA-binding NarL/FixJ family response regulator